jgi:hypothetical protein
MPWWLITVIAGFGVVGLLALLVLFFREELKGLLELLTGFRQLMWLGWCWIYIMRWRARFYFRSGAGQTALSLLLTGSLFVFLELVLAAFHLISGTTHGSPTDEILHRILSYTPEVEMPLWAELLAVVIAAWVLWHHWEEWKLRNRESAVPTGLARLIVDAKPFLQMKEPKDADIEQYFERSMKTTAEVLAVGRKRNVSFTFSMMLIDEGAEELAIALTYPAGKNYAGQRLSKAKSAAGRAWQLNAPIYVPSTKHLGGINMKTYRAVGLVYDNKADTPDVGPSLICIPVTVGPSTVAILNVSCNVLNAFSPSDVQIANVAATLQADLPLLMLASKPAAESASAG